MSVPAAYFIIVCTFKFQHIIGELSVSLECLCVRTALNRAEGNCITCKKKAKGKKDWVLGSGCLPYPCPILVLAGGQQVTSTDPAGARLPLELTGISLEAAVRTFLGECEPGSGLDQASLNFGVAAAESGCSEVSALTSSPSEDW